MTITTHPWVALIGKAGSGKDTFASFLVERHGYTRVAFADPLRDAALALDPIVDFAPGQYATPLRLSEYLAHCGDSWTEAKHHPEVRRTLQRMGVGIRDLDRDFWVRLGVERAASVDGPVVFTDVRFPNEVEAIVKAGGFTVRIYGPSRTSLSGEAQAHASETALDGLQGTFMLWNDSTLEALAAEADRFAPVFARFARSNLEV